MATKKISELDAATTPLTGGELAEIVQTGANKRVLVSEFGAPKTGVSFMTPLGNSNTVHLVGMFLVLTGTGTTANSASTNVHTATRRIEYAVTSASATAVAGVRTNIQQLHIGDSGSPFGGFNFVARFGPSRGVASNATRRFWAGMTSVGTAPTDVQPSEWATDGIGVGADAADTNWHIMHRTGTGTMTKIDTGIAKAYADTTEMFELRIATGPIGTPSVTVTLIRLSDGETFSSTITTNLPAPTTMLGWQIWNSVGGTSSVIGVSVGSVYIQAKY